MYKLKIILVILFLSLIHLNCSSQKPVIRSMGCLVAPEYTGEVKITSFEILTPDSNNTKQSILNYDSLFKKIKYTVIGERAGVEGDVIVKFIIDSDGLAKNVEIVKPLEAGLSDTVFKAVKDFRFIFTNDTIFEKSTAILKVSFRVKRKI